MRRTVKSIGLAVTVTLASCSGSGDRSAFDGSSDPGASSGGPPGSLGVGADGGTGGAPASGVTLLYAHTDTTLYQIDPDHLDQPLVSLGDFDCVGKGKPSNAMTDLAVTKDGKLFGVSEGAAFPLTLGAGTVHCESTWTLPQTKFYGLTVAPENTVTAAEVLIGADGDGGLWQIDATSGTPTQVGTLGSDPSSGKRWSLSGDIVFMANGGSPIGFATVRTCAKSGSCTQNDTLIEVDVGAIKPGTQSVLKGVRGAVTKGSWCTNASSPTSFGSMFGIVAYQSRVYGFSRAGDIVEIHNDDGSGCLVSTDPSRKFAGAGVTTSAPVVAPPAIK